MDDDIEYGNEEEYNYNLDEESDYYENHDLIKKNSNVLIVTTEQLKNLREKLISECCETTSLDRDDAIIVLINYKWDLYKVNQEWFNDVDKHRMDFGIDVSDYSRKKLQKSMIETKTSYCLICYSDTYENNAFSLKCSHQFCDDCWKGYVNSKLEDIFCCLFSTCPQKDCNLIVPESVFEKYIQDDSQNKKRFEQILLRNFSEQNLNIKWCPKDCGKCISSEVHYNQEIECECKYVYCFSCLREGHRYCSFKKHQ